MLRVYAHDPLALDLLVIGRVEMGLRNSKTVTEDFVARFVVDESTLRRSHDGERTTRTSHDDGMDTNEAGRGDDRVRLKLSRVWSVCVSVLFWSLFRDVVCMAESLSYVM